MFFTMAVRSVRWWISYRTYWATIKAMRIFGNQNHTYMYTVRLLFLCAFLYFSKRSALSLTQICPPQFDMRAEIVMKWGKGLSSYPSALTVYLFAPKVDCRGNFSYTVIFIPRQDVIITFKFWVDFFAVINDSNSQCQASQYIWKGLTYFLQHFFFEGWGR